MKVLFIGCGDLALRAIRQLRETPQPGYPEVICHGLRRRVELLPETLLATAGDSRDSAALTALLDAQQFDVLAVTLTPEEMSERGYRDSYVAGARSLARALEQTCCQPRGVIWASSTGVYGQHNGEWVDELAETAPASYRGKCLLEAEEIIAQLPVASVVLRYSGIYGPGRGRLLQQVKAGRIAPSAPVQWSNRIHAEDAAGVMVHILRRWQRGEALLPCYLATDNEPVPLHEVHAWLAARLVPAAAARGADQAGSGAGNRRCANRRLRDSGFVFRYPTFREGYLELLAEGRE